ncbi:MAG: HIT domain-containing protein [Alphaproteobacteria bacterium]|nr:HIT domain-containing protein [Alphaproteobacteria bacterium]
MTVYDDNNIFAKILRGEIPNTTVYEDEHVLAFDDIAPQAPVHVMVIPKGRYTSMTDFAETASDAEITALNRAVLRVVEAKGLKESGYRTLVNNGDDGGQEIPHLHIHVCGGKPLGPLFSR